MNNTPSFLGGGGRGQKASHTTKSQITETYWEKRFI